MLKGLLMYCDEELLEEISVMIEKYKLVGLDFNDPYFEKNLARNWKKYCNDFRGAVELLRLSNAVEELEMLPYPLAFVNTMIIMGKDEKAIMRAFGRKQHNATTKSGTVVAGLDWFDDLDK